MPDAETAPTKAGDSRRLGDPGSEAFQLDKYPFYLLNRTVSQYNQTIGAQLRTIGLDIPYWRVLMVLGEAEPRSVGQLAQACVINLSTMMRIVGRMREAGLVTSAAGADARVTEVFLSDAGRGKLRDARTLTAPIYDAVIAGFSAADFERMIGDLGRLYANLRSLEA